MLVDRYPCSEPTERGLWSRAIRYTSREHWTSSTEGPVFERHPNDWEEGNAKVLTGRSEFAAINTPSRLRTLESIEVSISDRVNPHSARNETDAKLCRDIVEANASASHHL